MSSNETISNKVGNATGGTLGDETLIHQTVHLIGSTIDYGKGVVGIGSKPARSVQDATDNPQGAHGSQTLGGLINESRDLVANVLGAVKDVVAPVTDTASDVANDAKDVANDAKNTVKKQKPVGYIGSTIGGVRNLAGSVIGTAQNIIATGANKVDENTPNSVQDIKDSGARAFNSATSTANDAKKKTENVVSQGQSTLSNAADSATIYGKAIVNEGARQLQNATNA